MRDLLKKVYDRAEEYQGRRLAKLLVLIFFGFTLVGIGVGLLIVVPLSNRNNSNGDSSPIDTPETVFYEGQIVYVDPNFYPDEGISYSLVNSKGKDIILLKAHDQKLVVAEGHYAKVFGNLAKTKDGKKDVLIVDKVVITNVPD